MKQSYTLSYVNLPNGQTDELDKPFGNLMALQHWVFANYPNATSYQIIVCQSTPEAAVHVAPHNGCNNS